MQLATRRDPLTFECALSEGEARAAQRAAYFGPQHGWLETRLVRRQALAQGALEGPLIIEEYDATTVIPPGCQASLDSWSNIVVNIH